MKSNTHKAVTCGCFLVVTTLNSFAPQCYANSIHDRNEYNRKIIINYNYGRLSVEDEKLISQLKNSVGLDIVAARGLTKGYGYRNLFSLPAILRVEDSQKISLINLLSNPDNFFSEPVKSCPFIPNLVIRFDLEVEKYLMIISLGCRSAKIVGINQKEESTAAININERTGRALDDFVKTIGRND